MKTHIVRSPGHDRTALPVPTGAGDLPHTAHGSAIQSVVTTAENGVEHTLALANFTELVGMTNSGSGSFSVAAAGLYMMSMLVVWDWETPGAIGRQIGVKVNGATAASIFQNSTVGDLHTDQFVYLYRLGAGDVVTTFVKNFNGGNATTALSSLQLVMVAP